MSGVGAATRRGVHASRPRATDHVRGGGCPRAGAAIESAVTVQSGLLSAARLVHSQRGTPFTQALARATAAAATVPTVGVRLTAPDGKAYPESRSRYSSGASTQLLLFIFLSSLTGAARSSVKMRSGLPRQSLASGTGRCMSVASPATKCGATRSSSLQAGHDSLVELPLPLVTRNGCELSRDDIRGYLLACEGRMGGRYEMKFTAEGEVADIWSMTKQGKLGTRQEDLPPPRHVDALRQLGFERMVLPNGKTYRLSSFGGLSGIRRVRGPEPP